jgi:hypothetical protein
VRPLFPILVLVAPAVFTVIAKLRERRLWASRRISGGRKALVLCRRVGAEPARA